MPRLRALARRHGIALLLYLLTAVVMLYPESVHPADSVSGIGDALESVYFLAWYAHQVVADPVHLFDANILHPHAHAVFFDNHRLLPSALAAPIVWATGNPILAYNLVLLAIYVFAAMGARQLAGVLGLDPVGRWAAGALYAFHSFQINECPRINTVFHGFIPLAVAELVTFLKTGERRRAWSVAALMLLQGLACNYNVVYGALLLAILVAVGVALRPAVVWRRIPDLLLPAAAAGVLFLPVIMAYVWTSRIYGYGRGLPEGIDLQHYLSTAHTNLLYGNIGYQGKLLQHRPHFVGFVSLALASLGLVATALWSREEPAEALLPRRLWVPAAAGLAALFVALSLGKDMVIFGHDLGPGPYRLLHDFVPGFQYLRFPERLSLIAMLFVGLLVGQAVSLLRWRGLGAAAIVLAALVPLEHFSPLVPLERLPTGDTVPQVYRWLARNAVGAVAELPPHGEGLVRMESLDEYFSTYHFKPIISGGLVTFPPPLSRLLRELSRRFPDEATLQAYQRVGVDTIVVHVRPGAGHVAREALAAERAGRLVSRASFSGAAAHVYEGSADEVFGLVHAPPAAAAPFPSGHPLRDPSWHYVASDGAAALAGDGNPETAWSVPGELSGSEFLQVGFGKALRVSGLVLPVSRLAIYPTSFLVRGRLPAGHWIDLAEMDDAHTLQLVDSLLASPGRGAIAFDLGDRELTALRLAPARGARGFDGWSVPELEVWVH